MATAHPYLHFNGNCETAFNFYRSVFGGDFESVQRFKEGPAEHPFPDHELNKILHIALPLSSASMLMGSDIPEAFPRAVNGTNFYISLDMESEEEAGRIFNKLAEGGNIAMPIDKTFWGAYFGMVVDKFGVQWMVSYNYARS